jgi:hypothetical protein
MALGVVVADYVVLWDDTFVLGGGGNPSSRDFQFSLPPGTQSTGAIFSFMLNTLSTSPVSFRVLVNGEKKFTANFSTDVFHSVHEVVDRVVPGNNHIRMEYAGGQHPIHFGDVILWFQRAI